MSIPCAFVLIRLATANFPALGSHWHHTRPAEWSLWAVWLALTVYLYTFVVSTYPGLRSVVRWSLWSAMGLAIGVFGMLALFGVGLSRLAAFNVVAACFDLVIGLFFTWLYPIVRRCHQTSIPALSRTEETALLRSLSDLNLSLRCMSCPGRI